jgi:hypothetical protein
MKKLYTTLLLFIISMISFSQTFNIHTAKASGLWSDSRNWDIRQRNDGIRNHKYIIPGNISITIDRDVDNLGDTELQIFGNLGLAPSTNLHLSSRSSITLHNGSITGNNANQKIKIGNEIKYKGNVDGVLSGYWIANSVTGSAPNGFVAFSLLSVNYTSFYVNKSGTTIELKWSVDKEAYNNHYDIERSTDGHTWTKIAVVSTASNSDDPKTYNYIDNTISNPIVYYRVLYVDNDGRSISSAVKTIDAEETISTVKIYGFEKNVVVDLDAFVKDYIVISVVNNIGRVIGQQSYFNPLQKLNLNLPNIARGAYIIQVTDGKGWSEAKKVIL